MKQMISIVGLIVLTLLVDGCTSAPKDLSGQTLPPTVADKVMLYQKKPSHYDIVGMVSQVITPDLGWDERAHAEKAFDLLKAQAAAKGANGILFELEEGEFDIFVNAGYYGQFYDVPMRLKPQRTAVARAILVKSN